ncbi:hypothetical protein HNY73_022015 [Argiope bruennichi]|uniref:Uncharacterized protein n=1 Tax=Argiope bruennichi TaxID=94029 RepID=A0A8T0E1U2_ARGBR|nr:hypothetical protein HNY73_022015 [Argiope bruennichi]
MIWRSRRFSPYGISKSTFFKRAPLTLIEMQTEIRPLAAVQQYHNPASLYPLPEESRNIIFTEFAQDRRNSHEMHTNAAGNFNAALANGH